LRLLRTTEYIDEKQFKSLLIDCEEIIKILTAILNSSKGNNNQNESIDSN
jgi:hypothetical protein